MNRIVEGQSELESYRGIILLITVNNTSTVIYNRISDGLALMLRKEQVCFQQHKLRIIADRVAREAVATVHVFAEQGFFQ